MPKKDDEKKPRAKKARRRRKFLDVSLVEILGAVVVCLLGALIVMSNGDTAKAQSTADASMVKASENGERISYLEATIKAIADSTDKTEKAATKMAESNGLLRELVLRHDEVMKGIDRRLDKLEK